MLCCLWPFESNMYLPSDMLWKHLEATCVIFQSFGHEEKCAHVVDPSPIRQPVERERHARLTAAFATKTPAVRAAFEIEAYSQYPVLLPMMELPNNELVFAHVKQQIAIDSSPFRTLFRADFTWLVLLLVMKI